jgi:hypothetical protein
MLADVVVSCDEGLRVPLEPFAPQDAAMNRPAIKPSFIMGAVLMEVLRSRPVTTHDDLGGKTPGDGGE